MGGNGVRVGLLVPGRAGEIGSVQIYAESVRAAFTASGEPGVRVYHAARDLSRLKRDLEANRLDVVQVENRPLRLREIRKLIRDSGSSAALVLNLHSLNFIEGRRAGLQGMARALALADAIVVNSVAVKSRFARLLPRAGTRALVVYPGVDASAFAPAASPCEVTRSPVVLFAGRLVKRKGLGVAIDAVRLLRRTHPGAVLLVVGGKGPRGSDPVVYAGKVSHERMPGMYSRADVLICPSQQFEAFGLVNVEAMAQGLPVVASRIGGIPEVVQHGVTGYLVRTYRSPAAFAASLRLALSPSRRSHLGSAGRRAAMERFQWTHTKDGLYAVYQSLLEAKAR